MSQPVFPCFHTFLLLTSLLCVKCRKRGCRHPLFPTVWGISFTLHSLSACYLQKRDVHIHSSPLYGCMHSLSIQHMQAGWKLIAGLSSFVAYSLTCLTCAFSVSEDMFQHIDGGENCTTYSFELRSTASKGSLLFYAKGNRASVETAFSARQGFLSHE